MLKYIVKRILIFIPTLFAISLLAFTISVNSPGDPVEALHSGVDNGEGKQGQSESVIRDKARLRHELGLDLPVFYFTLTNAASPDTLYKIYNPDEKEVISRLVNIYGDWKEISAWYSSLKELKASSEKITVDSAAITSPGKETSEQLIDEAHQVAVSLLLSFEEVVISSKLEKLQKMTDAQKKLGDHNFFAGMERALAQCKTAFTNMKSNATGWKTWIPALHFYGSNQYHRWLFGDGNPITGKNAVNTKGVLRGDFGLSYTSKLPVSEIISNALPWSLFFTLLSVLLAYIVSIPIGVKAAANRGGFFDRSSSVILFMLYSMPVFFLATLLLMTFANPEVINWFPANGIKPAAGYPAGISVFEKLRISLPYIILPLITYTYSSLAFLSRTMRVSMLEVIHQDYIRTAKAKGLSNFRVIYKHGLRNALLPIITVFANIFPIAVGGSVIIEVIFGIHGMGQMTFEAVGVRNYPVIVAVFTLSGFMTLVGYLIADILYAVVDPRITYSS
jgi:peptide/nickel transport system permease protein